MVKPSFHSIGFLASGDFPQCHKPESNGKDWLEWADCRVTDYSQIERWSEIVMSAFTMVSLFAAAPNRACPLYH